MILSLRAVRPCVDQGDAQFGADHRQVLAAEIAAVVNDKFRVRLCSQRTEKRREQRHCLHSWAHNFRRDSSHFSSSRSLFQLLRAQMVPGTDIGASQACSAFRFISRVISA